MNTPKKVLGAALAVAVGMTLKGCATTNTQTQVYGPRPYYNHGNELVLCSGFNGSNACRGISGCGSYSQCGMSSCGSINSCGSSGCQTFATTYVAVNNSCNAFSSCSGVNGCNGKYTFHKNNNVRCRLVGYVDP
ncbi:MAG TPA: hypothetical protein VHE99_03720 [Gammaproteobacteria bacterium]|nr:hypothetical protein [Gammaproteobacteria bacterium]